MLEELAQLLPKGHQVYVLFDSWYASAKLIKFCRRQRWQVICAVKTNRRIEKQRIDHYNQALKHQPYQRVTLEALDPHRKAPTYLVRTIHGHLQEIAEPIQAFISKSAPGINAPSTSPVRTQPCLHSKPCDITRSAGQWRSITFISKTCSA